MSCLNVQDDTRLWNVARSAAQIQSSYCSVLGHKNHGLLAYWKFEEVRLAVLSRHLVFVSHNLRAKPMLFPGHSEGGFC
jgi:hypothetical protein|eukprot:COSAG02_NODE_24936_length_673_cov_2.067944_1_plen_79_part_00